MPNIVAFPDTYFECLLNEPDALPTKWCISQVSKVFRVSQWSLHWWWLLFEIPCITYSGHLHKILQPPGIAQKHPNTAKDCSYSRIVLKPQVGIHCMSIS